MGRLTSSERTRVQDRRGSKRCRPDLKGTQGTTAKGREPVAASHARTHHARPEQTALHEVSRPRRVSASLRGS
jgi:hypothetical protein